MIPVNTQARHPKSQGAAVESFAKGKSGQSQIENEEGKNFHFVALNVYKQLVIKLKNWRGLNSEIGAKI